MSEISILNRILITAAAIVGLYFGKFLLLPLVIAVVVWYLLNSVGDLFGKIKIRQKVINRKIQLILGFILISFVTFVIIRLVTHNYDTFLLEYPGYHQNLIQFSNEFKEVVNVDFISEEWLENLDLTSLFQNAVSSSLDFMTTFFLVLLYVIFLLLEQQIMPKKIRLIYADRNDYKRFLGIVRKIDESIYAYVSLKTALCLIAGITSYLVLIIVGVDFAFLWGFLIFLLNYIPIIGAFIGIFFPTFIALLQFGHLFEPILVLVLLSVIQLTIGNFIEPKILGSKLNLSPLVVIISLSFWGTLWGIAGMFLCVPITVILMIILSQFEKTRSISILLSGGKVIQ